MVPDEPVTEVACQKASGRECCVGSCSVLHQDGPRKFLTLFQLIDEPFQCATGNSVPVDFFRSGSGPVPAKYRPDQPDLTNKFGCRI